jgi:hypothetical protein
MLLYCCSMTLCEKAGVFGLALSALWAALSGRFAAYSLPALLPLRQGFPRLTGEQHRENTYEKNEANH